MTLSTQDRAVLDFERLTWHHPGARESAIWERFGWSATRHAQVVSRLLEDSAALAYDPQLVRRLQRLRDRRRAVRSSRRARESARLVSADRRMVVVVGWREPPRVRPHVDHWGRTRADKSRTAPHAEA